MRTCALVLVLEAVLAVPAAGAGEPAWPFPQHLATAPGTVSPSHRTQRQQDDDVRRAYDLWKANYVARAGSEPDGRPRYRIRMALPDGARAGETVSEGQGYGMTIVALMAGHDPEARTVFDGLWEFTKDHPSRLEATQMDWHVPANEAPSGQPGGDDPGSDGSAFDGDCDIAFALLLADEQWGSAGSVDYRAEAGRVIAGLLRSVVGPDSHLPLLGDWVGVPPRPENDGGYPNQYTPRSSDLILDRFRAFGRATGDAAWHEVVAASQSVVGSLQARFSPGTGLLPDFVVPVSGTDHTPRPAPGEVLESPHDGDYYYNAGRDPWRLGVDGLLNNDPVSLEAARKMARWIERATQGSAARILPGYRLDGTPINPEGRFTSFFAAPFGVAAMTDPALQPFLADVYDAVRLSGGAPRVEDYYEDTVSLLCLLVMTRNTWDPTTIEATRERIVPIVLDVSSGTAHYTTELELTNDGPAPLPIFVRYTASLGSKEGSGTVADELAPGEQRIVPDALAWLRSRGLPVPDPAVVPQQGGTLVVTAAPGPDARHLAVTARTTTGTGPPLPVGRAGLAYGEIPGSRALARSDVTIFGLRSSPADRSNVALFNISGEPVSVRVTVSSGTGDGRATVFREAETLAPWGWLQYGSAQILDGTGVSNGWVTIERVSASGSFGAYAVINDNVTNDGSFVLPAGAGGSGSTIVVPVLVETNAFRSELVLANRGGTRASLELRYRESLAPEGGAGGVLTVVLEPRQQRIIPEAIDFLRQGGVPLGARGSASYAGSLRITVAGAFAVDVFAGARTGARLPEGGQFGLFTPGVCAGEEASSEAYVYGLRADAGNRSNVAVVHAGSDGTGPIVLRLQAHDGDAGGVEKGSGALVSLEPGQWRQLDDFLRTSGVANGWVHVARLSGTAAWLTYGVVNDGAAPGARTGDGAYVPMVR